MRREIYYLKRTLFNLKISMPYIYYHIFLFTAIVVGIFYSSLDIWLAAFFLVPLLLNQWTKHFRSFGKQVDDERVDFAVKVVDRERGN